MKQRVLLIQEPNVASKGPNNPSTWAPCWVAAGEVTQLNQAGTSDWNASLCGVRKTVFFVMSPQNSLKSSPCVFGTPPRPFMEKNWWDSWVFSQNYQHLKKRKQKSRKGGVASRCSELSLYVGVEPAKPRPSSAGAFYSDLWQYKSLRAFSSSIRVLFWFSRTATRFSRHLTYSFFFLRHSRAASLRDTNNRSELKLIQRENLMDL